MIRSKFSLTGATALALMAVAAAPAAADTLRDALLATYRSNPTVTAQRETLRATDASVAIARAAGRPQVSATAGVNQDLTRTGGGNGRNLSAGLDVSYPLFNGGSVRNNVRAAETRVEAGRYTLKAVEGDAFVEAVTTYMDVIRDRAIVALNQNNVDVLGTNLRATSDRFKIGDLTRTDVAQSDARLALGRSQLVTSQGRLTASEENYRRVVGHNPGELAPPPPLPPLPATADDAVQVALVYNPDLVAIVRSSRAAGYDINVARAGRLPTISAIGSGRYTNYLGSAGDQFGPLAPNSTTSTGVGVQARLPIYQGGLPAARIRQAQAIEGQILEQAIGTERAVVATTRSAFATYQAALNAIAANQTAVSANTLALQGARAERTVGTRTVLDVLNAEQELLNSQVTLVTARHDAYVAGFQLLNAMGQAQADRLGLDGGPLYDPLGNYRHVAHNKNDWANDPNPVAVATRTVVPAEMPVAGPPAPPIDQTRVTAPQR
jgi:outer membrane protein